MMLSAQLRHRVNIEKRMLQRGNNGEVLSDHWVGILINEPVHIVPLSGREFIAANAIQSGVNTRITMRFYPEVTADMRIKHGRDIYNIKAVLPDSTLRRHLTLMCERGVNRG